ncbi:MAG: DUF2063 domain-containing protein [Candidatus Pelagadaptatus aseana]|uniref:HvfC family RiPP maturation protein n=1 Tax=Candidatus Pelagadaptatus aseana TaxID=3120508 RepID=UPI0039B233AC
MTTFIETQKMLADHLRDPAIHAAPDHIEERRLKIYRDLIFKNIEGFIRGGFPILSSLYDEADWQLLVRSFIRVHQSESPYFLEVSQEFLRYLQDEHEPRDCDPDFMLELAHYEWVELALDVSEESIPENRPELESHELLQRLPTLSPLAWCLSYQYPVHLLGPEYQPDAPPEEPTFLIVYRNRADQVQFMASNAMTTRLLNLMASGEYESGRAVLLQLAAEMQHPEPEKLVVMGEQLLEQLYQSDIVL